MRTKAFLIALIVTLAVCNTALAQTNDPPNSEPLILTDKQGRYPLGLHLELLEDPSGELTIEDVSSLEFNSRFVPSQSTVPNYGYTDSVYWVRFRLENRTPRTDEWLLEQGFANTHFIDLYTPNANGRGFTVKQTGVLRPVATRDVFHPRIIFNMNIPPQSQATYYLRIQSGGSMTLPLTLWTKTAFLNYALGEQTLMGIFYGVLIGLLLYNLFLFYSLRELNYLFFVLLLANLIFEEASYGGYLRIYIIPNLNIAVEYIEPVALPLLIGSMVLFADSFLELKHRHPKLHMISLVILAVWGGLLILVPFISYGVMARLMVPWSLISLLMLLIAGTFSFTKGYRASRFFLLAWLGLLLSLVWVFLVRLGLAASSLLSENAFLFGYLWMVVCWSIALADRINLLKADTENANRELRESENRLSEILEGLPVGVVVYGKDEKPKYVNRKAIEILTNPDQGIRPDLSAGRTIAEAIQYFKLRVAGQDREYPLGDFPVTNALQGKPGMVDDIEADLVDRLVPLEVSASPVRDDAGNVESAVVVFQDISARKQAEKAQQISETRFRIIAENSYDGIAFMGRDREVLYASPSYQRLVGKTAEELIGQSGIGLVHPDDRDYTAEKFKEALQQPNTRIIAEYRIPHKDGSWIWVETFAINLLDNPSVQAVVLNSHDISERKQTEAELAEYRTHLENLVETRTEELSSVNEQLQLRLNWLSSINLINQVMARSADFSRIYEEIIAIKNTMIDARGFFIAKSEPGTEQLKILAHSCPEKLEHHLVGTYISLPDEILSASNLDGNFPACFPMDQLGNLGEPMGTHLQESSVQNLALVPLILREQFYGYLGLEMDEDKLFLSEEESELLRIFSTDIAQLIENERAYEQSKALIAAEERNRLARDLHDSVTQTLFTASIMAETTPRLWEKDQGLARLNMDKLSVLIRGALAEMRSLLIELRAGELRNQSLDQLLTTLAEAGRVRSHTAISISVSGDHALTDKETLAFYRIAQEALSNAINHAQATQITISLIEDPDSVELRIQDDGRGFIPQDIPEGHLGINIMLERAAQIGADLRIISEPGEGTEVILTWSDEIESEENDRANND